MSLSSLFFVLFFLPVFSAVYAMGPDMQAKNRRLLAFSLLFYAFGGIRYLLLLLIMTGIGWFAAVQMERSREADSRRRWLILSVILFLGTLGVFKYTGFFLGTLGALVAPDWTPFRLAAPLGISFYTFKLLSYVADVYRGEVEAEGSYAMLLLYTSIFYQSLQGPIARYAEMREELYHRRTSYAGISSGIYRFSVGLAKKTILADHVGKLADSLIPMSDSISSSTTLAVWVGAICYSMQIYLDFSAYTDMAIGLGEMVGFHFPENFRYPYTAVSVRDFWRRWHITLSSFFRDYVYIPLGGNRVSPGRLRLNLLAVWALTGLWHGASWNFVLWGLFYFAFISYENWRKKEGKKDWHPILQHLYTILVFQFGWILFRFTNVRQLGIALAACFGIQKNGFASQAVLLTIQNNMFLLIFCALACTPFFVGIRRYLLVIFQTRRVSRGIIFCAKSVFCVLMIVFSLIAMAGSSFTPFLYNQF